MSLIALDGVVAGYRKPVVGPVSFALDAGEVLGLWGPNGSGKSTLLKALANAARIYAGSVQRAPGLTLAWQPQEPVRLDQMPFSGHDYLRYGRAGRTPPERLRPWLEARVDRLSGGQFQLLCVWASLGGDAGLVLLDEPTNNLDPEGEAILAGILQQERRQAQGRRGVLVVSHERSFLARACSRVVEVGP